MEKKDKNPVKYPYDYIVVEGVIGVGKTSLAIRYTQNRFESSYLPTLGVDFYSKVVSVGEDLKIKVVVFDTVGQSKLVSLRKRYYTGAHGAIIVYDITRRESFEHIQKWIDEISEKCKDIPFIIVGNKTDLDEKRDVIKKEAEDQWLEKGYTVLESSAKLGEGVDDIYKMIAKEVTRKMSDSI